MLTTARRRRLLALVVAAALSASGLAVAAPLAASAEGVSTTPPDTNPPGAGTEATIVDMIDRSGLFGGTVPTATATTPYPTSGLQNQRSVETAQIVLQDPGSTGVADILAYCIDLATQTTVGVHYELGTWTEANVPNLAYVQWILENSYPTVPSVPAGTPAEKVRAVQGAIWYFTDQFVVSTFYPQQRSAVAAIVAAAQAAVDGTTPTPPPLPTLTIDPASLSGVVDGDLVGPYDIGGDVDSSTIRITGTEVFRDAAGTVPVIDGDIVVPGEQLWARYDAQTVGQGFELTAVATVPAGNVYLYNGNNPPRRTAQKLVLAASTQVPIRAAATIVHPEVASLQVDVEVGGAAAGQQGQIVVVATCVTALVPTPIVATRTVPAGATAGIYTFLLSNIPDDDTTCEVEQISDGSSSTVLVDATIEPASVVLSSAATQLITVTDLYSVVTSGFAVDVTIAGAAAGSQGAVSVLASCDSGASVPFTLPAGTAAGTHAVGAVTGIPVGATCTVTQTADGANAAATLTSSSVTPASVVIAPDSTPTITLANTYAVPTPVTPPLPATGDASGTPWGAAMALMLAGGLALAFTAIRRRHARC